MRCCSGRWRARLTRRDRTAFRKVNSFPSVSRWADAVLKSVASSSNGSSRRLATRIQPPDQMIGVTSAAEIPASPGTLRTHGTHGPSTTGIALSRLVALLAASALLTHVALGALDTLRAHQTDVSQVALGPWPPGASTPWRPSTP